ncbi:hypothetical protein B5X24_HaOG207543 [Helicoverpa armigera]|nr:hypothetical protein B5X24_HaOG207543 [Helicoverpa armigera]
MNPFHRFPVSRRNGDEQTSQQHSCLLQAYGSFLLQIEKDCELIATLPQCRLVISEFIDQDPWRDVFLHL